MKRVGAMVEMPIGLLEPLRAARRYWRLPRAARAARRRDRAGLPESDSGARRVIEEGMAWLGRAQDHSLSNDGGVARHFSLVSGWSASYPETTGYVAPTVIEYAERRNDLRARARGRRMLDWLVSIQFPDGGFQGGMIDERPVVPVTFNTGQILIGLAKGADAFGAPYRHAMIRAADWLAATQDPDGCWRRFASPFAHPGEKSYDAHVAWGLFEAARVEPNRRYAETAMANIRWALSHQRRNGWFDRCCLTDPSQALTHTIGYVLRGVIEAHRFTGEASLLEAARKTADGLLPVLGPDGALPGRLHPDWTPAAEWVCLTGSSQIALCWLLLYQHTGHRPYRDAAFRANRYVRRTIDVRGAADVRGAVKGSFPVDGGYNPYQYLNWACKFTVDANVLEMHVRDAEHDATV
jgi:hypothetical protein